MITSKDVAWVAGFLEGEGYFGINNRTPRIYVNQTDKDVVEKLRDIMSPEAAIGFQERDGNRQNIYRFWLYGEQAASWMMTIYSLMGIRRKQVIRESLEIWRESEMFKQDKAIRALMVGNNISREEAKRLWNTMIKRTE